MNGSIRADGATSSPAGIVAPFDNEIQSALAALSSGDFAAAAIGLLAALGYRSERTLLGQTGDVGDFIAHFPAANPDTHSERGFQENVRSVRILFQLTSDEIASAGTVRGADDPLSEAADFDTGQTRSFIFVAAELNGQSYPRGQYAAFSREINKRLSQPSVALFKSGQGTPLLTLAFVHRRKHKRDERRDVLGSVSLIREIDPVSPHRAHLDILAELALADRLRWMDARGLPRDFDGLLAAWLDALDTEELNRRFYRALFAWFERAVGEATFLTSGAKTLPAEEHVIRLITRLLFIWFIREKGLIAEDLFIETRVGPLLREYDRDAGDSYYRAVLQNLFFATLNSELDRRGFSRGSNATHRDFSRYRYRTEMADPDALLSLFARTPFINGGLFDCLDSEEATGDSGYRIDCFSDNANQRGGYSIPNRLFFGPDGLISLFKRYKFTVEENTPAEQEVALDPELLGKVFENLLAAYNPETRATARKQTGSYYTPRPVVDYMVDEALAAALAAKARPADGDGDFWRERLRYLLDYADAMNDADELFDESERQGIVRAIAGLTLLDPAVGSGAFPMGALHKLTLALRRLDPDNRLWEQLQKELVLDRAASAFDRQDQRARDTELQEISDTFEKYRDSDFGRKLYLIQNSIYGVDIQTVATQIAKLRFFISLAIEQDPTGEADDNYGIKPLPNLETRFVAADTLLGLDKPLQMSLGQTDVVSQLRRELNANRERHFHAATRRQKLACREKDWRLRDRLAAALRQVGLPADDAEKIARWDPYDQNASADWFDAEYMFGVGDGFDVVIGNPPYGIPIKDKRSKIIGSSDSYANFMALVGEIAPRGVMAYITPTSWETAIKFKEFRQNLFSTMSLETIVNLPYDVFTAAYIDTAVTIGKFVGKQAPTFQIANLDKKVSLDLTAIHDYLTPVDWTAVEQDPSLRIPLIEWATDLYRRILEHATPMGELTESRIGILASKSDIREQNFTGATPFFSGQVDRYRITYLTQTAFVAMNTVSAQVHDGPRLLTRRIVSRSNRLMSARTMEEYVVKKDLYTIKLLEHSDTRLATLLAILNSKLMSFLLLSRSATATRDDFRQVTLTELRELPILLPDSNTLERELSQLVRTREHQEDQAADMERQIDEIIYRIYGVTHEEKEAIDAWLTRSG